MARASAECLAAARSGLPAPDAYINLDHGRSTDSREFLQASSIRRRQHKGLSPANSSRLACDLRFPFNGESYDGPLFLADVMEDKWDIYLYDGRPLLRPELDRGALVASQN